MKEKASSSRTLKRVIQNLEGQKHLVVLSFLLALVSVAGTLFVPILVGRAIDEIVGPGQVDFAALGTIGVQIAVTAGVVALSQWLMNIINNKITFRVTREVRQEAFSHLQMLPLAYLDAHPSGEIVSRMISDTEQFADGLLLGFTQLFTGVLTIAGTLGFMLSLDWRITLVVVILTPLSLFAAKFIATRTYDMFRMQSKTLGEQTALVGEMLDGERVVQAFSREERAVEAFDEINGRLQKYTLRATFFSSLTNPVTRFVNSIVYACVALTGALVAVAGGITVGGLSVFLSYANQYAKPFNDISGVVTELQNAMACAGRVFELIDEPSETADAESAVTLEHADGRVELKNVSFRYVADRPLIEDLNVSVRPGERVAIVGPTGCGKTTLINLLMRFYDVNGGEIRVSGERITDLTRRSLRQNFGMVLQDTWIKTGTVRENIRYARPDATDAEIEAACREANCDGFIRKMEKGYDTPIGENGNLLSGGERQRLSIARAILKNSPILLLDEATASLDIENELAVKQAIANLLKEKKTVVMIAHTLSIVKNADQILVVSDGRITEAGTHKELLAKDGKYAAMWNAEQQLSHFRYEQVHKS